MKKLLIILIILLLPLGAFAQGKSVKIVTLGDSFMTGYGVSERRDFASTLERHLWVKRYRDFKILNASKEQNTSVYAARLMKSILRQQPDIVIVALGYKDVKENISLQTTYKNLQEIISTLQKANVKILLVGFEPPLGTDKESAKKMTGMYKYLAKQNKIPLYPNFMESLKDKPYFMLSDGVHPNQGGIKDIVHNIGPYVERMMR